MVHLNLVQIMNLLRTSCFKFSINFWFMFFKCTLEFYTLSSKPDDLIIFYVHLYHCFACVFTAAIKTDESLHVLQTDQGNHIHQWNTFIFSLFQQETQERNHQEWKLLDTVVLLGAKWCSFLGAWWHSVWPRWWLLVILERELPDETDSTNISSTGS